VRHIRGHVKARWLGGDQRFVIPGQDLCGYSNNTVAMMVIQKPDEVFLPDQKSRVFPVNLAFRLGKRAADFGEPREALIFDGYDQAATGQNTSVFQSLGSGY
jgi:hypothetical protein